MRFISCGPVSSSLARERAQEEAFELAITLIQREQRRRARRARITWLREMMAGRLSSSA